MEDVQHTHTHCIEENTSLMSGKFDNKGWLSHGTNGNCPPQKTKTNNKQCITIKIFFLKGQPRGIFLSIFQNLYVIYFTVWILDYSPTFPVFKLPRTEWTVRVTAVTCREINMFR